MIIRAIGFNPLRYEVNGMEVPVIELPYLDEDSKGQSVKYIEVDGQKIVMEMKDKILEKVYGKGLDAAIIEVEEERQKKEDEKTKPK